MNIIYQFTINFLKGLIMQEIIKKIVVKLLSKEKIIGFVAGVLITTAGAAVDLAPEEIHDIICKVESK